MHLLLVVMAVEDCFCKLPECLAVLAYHVVDVGSGLVGYEHLLEEERECLAADVVAAAPTGHVVRRGGEFTAREDLQRLARLEREAVRRDRHLDGLALPAGEDPQPGVFRRRVDHHRRRVDRLLNGAEVHRRAWC